MIFVLILSFLVYNENMITKKNNRLIINDGFGSVWIEPWGKDSVRIRMTNDRMMDKNDWALEGSGEVVEKTLGKNFAIEIEDVETTYFWAEHFDNVEKTFGQVACLKNGNIAVFVNHENWISFWKTDESDDSILNCSDENRKYIISKNQKVVPCGKLLFEEQWRNRWRIDRFCVPTNTHGRELVRKDGAFSCQAKVQFEAYDDEHFYGMGQYQDSHLDKKGGIWELAQKNSQASVPFVISSRGYGFLWNNPAIGTANFASNGTYWNAVQTKKIDYWVTCGNPRQIEENYSEVVGRTPMMPEYAMGFWQCKLRYRNQEEVLSVAREYKKRNLPLDVIVIDFFHWSCQGDFKFDAEDWPDPDAMVKELSEMGVKLMVSVWPTIDERSENFPEMAENGLLISFDKKDGFNMDWMGNTVFYDTTNPQAREYVWNKCKENYFKKGIQLFWLDEAEPEYGLYNFEHYNYHIGPAMECSNIYPKYYAQGFYDGLKQENVETPLSLVRCAWVGSQKYGTVVWSGDVHSDFKSLRNQLQAGLSMGMAGIPWWTTDIGGFLGGDIKNDDFKELLIRWFQWGVFCPVMRLHGERPPFKKLEKEYHEVGGHQIKQMESGQDNEVWSFGDDVYEILKNLLELRKRLKPYISQVMKEASEKGYPVMRPLFFEFNEDKDSWFYEDEYMFGSKLLVCPVTQNKCRTKEIYLPKLSAGEKWIDCASGNAFEGGQKIEVDCPLDKIPVFARNDFEIKIYN